MNYIEFKAGNKEYKLRMNVRNTIALEKQLGMNPLAIFGNGDTLPTLTVMVHILHYSLQQYQHNITLNDSYDIFEEWMNDGNSVTDFIPIIIEIYKASGIIKGDAEKN
jgi:hypothetical protein